MRAQCAILKFQIFFLFLFSFTIIPKKNCKKQLEDSSENSDNTTMAIIGKICLSIYYETKLNSLTITIFRGHLNMVKKNKNDLYVYILLFIDHLLIFIINYQFIIII